jgi:hypothetical protein
MKQSMIYLAAWLLVASCTKDKGDEPLVVTEQELQGAWTWTRTQGGIANQINETPASEGKTVEIQFLTGKSYLIRTNGITTSQGTYELVSSPCIHSEAPKTLIDLSNDEDLMVEAISDDALHLSDDFHDGLHFYYDRKP